MARLKQESLSIGDLAAATGCKVQTIRYYETVGMMPQPSRSAGNQRVYDGNQAQRLAFIRHARELGFPLDAIRELLTLSDHPEQPCEKADRIARDQLAAVKSRILRLEGLKRELERMVRQCRRGHISDCRVIGVLADHSHAQCRDARHAEGEESDRLR